VDIDAAATHRKDTSVKDQQIARLEQSLSTQAQLYKAYVVSLTSALNTSKLAQAQLQIERDRARAYLLNIVQQNVDSNNNVVACKLDIDAMVKSGDLPPTPSDIHTAPDAVITNPVQPAELENSLSEVGRNEKNASVEFASEMLSAMFPQGGSAFTNRGAAGQQMPPIPLTLTAFAAATRHKRDEVDDGFQQVVQALSEDLEQYKSAAEQARADVIEERRATRDASTAVMEANLRRAQVQAEADHYLEELIEVKVWCAICGLSVVVC
jgi:hypothetical protein